MEYIKINRLRGDVADFTVTDIGMRVTFAGKQPKNPPIDLSAEQCRRFLNELTEALDVFYPDGEADPAVPQAPQAGDESPDDD